VHIIILIFVTLGGLPGS